MCNENKRFYIYGLFYEDDEGNEVCFYIGRGTGNRKNRHFWKSNMQECYNDYKVRTIRKYQQQNRKLKTEKLCSGLTIDQAKILEERLLNRDDVFDKVTNLIKSSSGFEPGHNVNSGKMLSEEHKQKLSETLTGRKFSEETKQKMSEAAKGRTLSEKTKRKISETLKENTLSDKTKDKIANTMSKKNKGKDNPHSKLSQKAVGEIKWYLKNTDKLQKKIANIYNVSEQTISGIKKGRVWSDVDPTKPKGFEKRVKNRM